MAIAATGIISGLDVNTVIAASMKLEQLPLNRFKAKLSSTESQISAMGKVKSAIATLQEAAKALSNSEDLRAFKGTLSNTDLATVTANGKAAAGTFKIDVEKLATSHKLASAGNLDVSAGGTLKIGTGNNANPVEVNFAAGSSLSDVAKAINDSKANVSATVVNGKDGQQLVLTSKDSGEAGKITLDSSIGGLNFNPASGTATPSGTSMGELTAAQNAIVKIDGIQLANTSSNTITDGITGVTLNLKATGSSQLSLERDDSALETKVKAFVDAYNSARGTMKSLSQYDVEGKGKNSGALSGNGSLNSIMNELRGLLSQSQSGSAYPTLNSLGIESTSSGTLSFNSTKFNAAAQADFPAMSKSLSAFASAFDAATTRMNSSDGMITRQVDGLNATKRRLDDNISAQERRLEIVQKRYEKQFANLETILSSIQKTGNQLSQQLASLNKSS